LPGSGALLKSRSGPQAEHNESMTSVRQYTARKANQMLVVVVSDERMFGSRVPRLSPSPVRSVDTYKGYRFLLPPTTLHILIYGCRRLSIEPAHCFYHIYYQVRVRVQVHDSRLCVTSSWEQVCVALCSRPSRKPLPNHTCPATVRSTESSCLKTRFPNEAPCPCFAS
jgi:hypothetical protein